MFDGISSYSTGSLIGLIVLAACLACLFLAISADAASTACAQEYSSPQHSASDSGETVIIIGVIMLMAILGKIVKAAIKALIVLGIILLLIVLF